MRDRAHQARRGTRQRGEVPGGEGRGQPFENLVPVGLPPKARDLVLLKEAKSPPERPDALQDCHFNPTRRRQMSAITAKTSRPFTTSS